MSSAPRDLMDFQGDWKLSRVIEDRLTDKDGQLAGRATLEKKGEGLVYRETGSLTYGDAPPLMASRVYRWARAPEGGIAVSFEDGTAFHDFTLSRTMPEATHICDPDMYYVTYDFARWPRWSSDWRVVGPRKNYRMVSQYQKAF